METYQKFLQRINSFEKETLNLGGDKFSVNAGLAEKVDESNKFKPFFGDTVVFDLDDVSKSKIADIANELHNKAPDCFCEKLVSDTFHMTLHDLNNSPILENITSDISKAKLALVKKLEENPIKSLSIKMKTNNIFNMVNTSVVLGLCPTDEFEYKKLMELYNFVDEIKGLPYPFTPHITLAYYNRNGFSEKSAKNLESVVNQLNKNTFELSITTEKLVYQNFTNMNTYNNVFTFLDFSTKI